MGGWDDKHIDVRISPNVPTTAEKLHSEVDSDNRGRNGPQAQVNTLGTVYNASWNDKAVKVTVLIINPPAPT